MIAIRNQVAHTVTCATLTVETNILKTPAKNTCSFFFHASTGGKAVGTWYRVCKNPYLNLHVHTSYIISWRGAWTQGQRFFYIISMQNSKQKECRTLRLLHIDQCCDYTNQFHITEYNQPSINTLKTITITIHCNRIFTGMFQYPTHTTLLLFASWSWPSVGQQLRFLF